MYDGAEIFRPQCVLSLNANRKKQRFENLCFFCIPFSVRSWEISSSPFCFVSAASGGSSGSLIVSDSVGTDASDSCYAFCQSAYIKDGVQKKSGFPNTAFLCPKRPQVRLTFVLRQRLYKRFFVQRARCFAHFPCPLRGNPANDVENPHHAVDREISGGV